MVGTFWVIVMLVLLYTVLCPILTQDVKHLKYGLFSLFVVVVLVFILHLTHRL